MYYVDAIKQVMQEKGYSQKALADILSVNQTTVGQWLSGRKKPSYDNILALYEKLGVMPNWLFGID